MNAAYLETTELFLAYSDIVASLGPNSEEARQMRLEYADNEKFIKFADGFDRLKKALSGNEVSSQNNR